MKMNELQTMTSGSLTTAAGITEDLYKRFISFCDAKPQTIKTYTVALQTFFYYLHDQQITRPDTDDIIRYKSFLMAQYSPCTVSLYLTACRLFFRWTAQRGYYPNIADHVKGANINRRIKKREALTSSQVKDVFSTVDRETLTGKRDYAILALMTAAGLRDIEVSRANIEDLRPAGDEMALYIQGKGKDDKESVIVPAEVEKAIRIYLSERGETDRTAPLFVSASNHAKGERLTTRSISRIVKQHFAKAGLVSEHLTAHSLRHTAITLSLLAGKTAQETQTFARHADISTTMIYAHNIDEVKTKTACSNAVAAAIF